MKKVITVISFFVLAAIGGFYIKQHYRDKPNQPTEKTPSASQPISPRPKPTETKTSIPQNWTYLYDGALNFQLAYPATWTARPATNIQGESTVYSYKPNQELGTGPVAENELKIAVIYLDSESSKQIVFEELDLVSKKQITVDGFNAIQRVSQNQSGGSISTEIEINDNEKYFVFGYPADSQLINLYQQTLQYIDIDKDNPVNIKQPEINQQISSSISIKAEAPGSWFNEGQLPMELKTVDGKVIKQTSATTTQNWMTEQLVEFNHELVFKTQESNYGYLVIKKSNPSGIPNNQQSFYWPLNF
jgi:hypothetical protein